MEIKSFYLIQSALFLINYQGRIKKIAEQVGLSKPLNINCVSIIMEYKITVHAVILYSIIMDTQLGLELPSILNGTDILQGMFFMLLEK